MFVHFCIYFYFLFLDKVRNTAMTNVAPALQESLCYISYHISIHFTHPEKRSTVGRPLLFYLILLGSTGFYSSHSFSAVPPLLR